MPDGLLSPLRLDAVDGRDIQRRGQIVDNGVQQRLHTLVPEGRAAEHRHEEIGQRSAAQSPANLFLVEITLRKVVGKQIVGGFRHGLQQLFPEFLGLSEITFRDLVFLVLGSEGLVLVAVGFHPHEVDDTRKLVFRTHRNLDGYGNSAEFAANLVDHPRETGSDPVHLVDEGDARHAVAVGLPPDGLRLGLDPADSTKNSHRAVKDAEAAFDFRRKIHMSRSIDDIDAMVPPAAGRCRRGDRDPPLLFLSHPVHRRRPLMHLPKPVVDPGVVEDALRGRRLTGVNVGHDADIADLS